MYRNANAQTRPPARLSSRQRLSPVISLDLALEFDRQRLPFAIPRFANGHSHPTFADAIFLNVVSLLVVKANADVARENIGMMMWTARVGAEVIGERGVISRVGHAA